MFSRRDGKCERRRCVVKGCKYSERYFNQKRKIPPDVFFHRVPEKSKRPHDHQKWKEILKTDFLSRPRPYVCSIHFDDSDYRRPPSVLRLLSYRPIYSLRESAVPRFNLEPREQDSHAVDEIQPIEVKQEEDQLQYFPQETVYLPSSSTELYEENSEDDLSDASSEHRSLLFEDTELQDTTHLPRFVQCDLGSEQYCRLSNGDGCAEDSKHPDKVSDDPPRSSTGNTASEGLDGIATIPNVSMSEDQEVQCELGVEVNRWGGFVESKHNARYVCISDCNCPCELPKQNRHREIYSLHFDQSNCDGDSREDKNSENNSEDSRKDNDREDNREDGNCEVNSYACSVCKNTADISTKGRRPRKIKGMSKPDSNEDIRPMKAPLPNGTQHTLKPFHLRHAELVQVASIIHKRSTPNILRRKQLLTK